MYDVTLSADMLDAVSMALRKRIQFLSEYVSSLTLRDQPIPDWARSGLSDAKAALHAFTSAQLKEEN